MPEPGWSLIAHGGARSIPAAETSASRAGLEKAVRAGGEVLERGGSALDAVELVVKMLEDDPAYNAGLSGSVLNAEGKMELSASIMDGRTLAIGAVAGITQFANPVSIARRMLPERTVFLIGEGAERYAREQGFATARQGTPAATASPGCDTVGCVARDKDGNLAAGTSTGGLRGVKPGRVGDVPLPGCGFYAENDWGAVSCSGEGESIARALLTSQFLHLARTMPREEAAAQALKKVERAEGDAGLISIAPDGSIFWAHNSEHFAVGMARQGEAIRVYLEKKEEHA